MGGGGGGGLGGSSVAIVVAGVVGNWQLGTDNDSELYASDPGFGGLGDPGTSKDSDGWIGSASPTDTIAP